ncbi:protein Daple-like [Leptopilina heterotoma]|uniref:protein Daple-like n=1 Tax=Leptopilina heterotoma TaxID=63436 RepID=UPI001CA8AB6E|nr:protein Daple-like [Leptopilina heterotoma]
MSTSNLENSNSISCRGDNQSSNIDTAINKRCLKRPIPISARQKTNTKANIGTTSHSKADLPENGNLTQRSNSKTRARSSSVARISKNSNNSQKRIIENQYLTKKNRYNVVRKEMENKHKVAVEMYDEVLQLRDKVISMGAKDPGKPEEIGLISYIDNEFMENIESNLHSIPESLIDFCKKVLSDRMEIVSWVMEYDHQDCENDFALNEKIEIFRNEDNELIEKLEFTRKQQTELIENLTKKLQSLWTECQSYRSNFKNSEQNILGVEKFKNLLEIEMEKSQKLKEGKSLVENQLAKVRSKLKDFENQMSNSEGKVSQLQNSLEHLKTQLKQKEALLEQQNKDLQKASRSNKSTVSKLEAQRETLESRLASLTTELSNKTNDYELIQKRVNLLEDRVKELDQEKQLRLQVEAKLAELMEYSGKLEKENKELSKKAESLVNKGLNETKLCTELEDAKTTILKQEERIDQLHKEREELVAAMKRVSGQELSEEKQNKLISDLTRTTNELKNFKDENLQLKKNLKSAVNKGENVQKQLTELHARLQNQCKENGKADWSVLIIDLQQQNSDLKCTITDVARQNKKLEAELSQKQVELECLQHFQDRILKAKEEMKNKHLNKTAQKKVGPGSSATQDYEDIFNKLEEKQTRIMQLEKMLKQMEDQQERSQTQRVRLESRIAQLEVSAKEKTHRYVGDYNVPVKNFPKTTLNIPSPPASKNLFQELQLSSPRNKISKLPKFINSTSNKKLPTSLKSPRIKISPRNRSIFHDKEQNSKNSKNHIDHFQRGGQQLTPLTNAPKVPKVQDSQYDWLLNAFSKPRFTLNLNTSPTRESPRDKNLRNKSVKSRRICSQSKESIIRGYKRRSFRFNRPHCDYQSPRKQTPSIRVRQYTV